MRNFTAVAGAPALMGALALALATACVRGDPLTPEPRPTPRVGHAVKHPILKVPAGFKARMDGRKRNHALTMSDQEIQALISDKCHFKLVGCPHCNRNVTKRSGSSHVAKRAFKWSIGKPHQLTCSLCGTTYPHENYPLDKIKKVVNPLGETQEYRYYQDALGQTYFLAALARKRINMFFQARAYELAVQYHLTKDPKYAHKAAVILDRFAEVYPAWPVHGYFPAKADDHNRSRFYDAQPPHPYWSGKWSRWFRHEVSWEFAITYDLICNSDALDKLSAARGRDVRRHIETNLLRAMADFFREYDRGEKSLGCESSLTGLMSFGRVLGEPLYVHDSIRSFKNNVMSKVFYDGVLYCVSPDYHLGILRDLNRTVELARGYSDPPGWTDPVDGLHFQSMDLERDFAVLQKLNNYTRIMTTPQGFHVPVHDSWPASKAAPRSVSRPVLFGGAGHAILGRGKGPNQVQAHLHYSGCYFHAHLDLMNIILYAKGRELLSDIGYSHTRLRPWTWCTLGHNTVVVNGENQRYTAVGNTTLFAAHDGLVQAAEARGMNVSPAISEYRRTLVSVGVSEEDAYVVDLFRVKGGSVHDWVIHGDADHNQTAECSVPLKACDGNMAAYNQSAGIPAAKYYDHITRLHTGQTDTTWNVTFSYRDASPVRLKTTMLGRPGTTLIIGRAPSVRRAGERDADVEKYHMPIVLARRQGRNLSSRFVAVHEPCAGNPLITGVRRIEVTSEAPSVIALEVQLGERTDTIISTTDCAPFKTVRLPGPQDIVFKGRLGVVSEINGKVQWLYLADGERLAKGDAMVRARGAHSGDITGAERPRPGATSFFRTRAALPTDGSLNGKTVVVTRGNGLTHAYAIARIERKGNNTLIHINGDHGLDIAGDTTRLAYFPHTETTGPNRFHVCPGILRRVHRP